MAWYSDAFSSVSQFFSEFAGANNNLNTAVGSATQTGWGFAWLGNAWKSIRGWWSAGDTFSNYSEGAEYDSRNYLADAKGRYVTHQAELNRPNWKSIGAEAAKGSANLDAAVDKAEGGGWFSSWFGGDDDNSQSASNNQVAAVDPGAVAPAPMGAGRNTLLSSLAANVQPSGNITGGSTVAAASSPPPVTNRSASDDISQAIL